MCCSSLRRYLLLAATPRWTWSLVWRINSHKSESIQYWHLFSHWQRQAEGVYGIFLWPSLNCYRPRHILIFFSFQTQLLIFWDWIELYDWTIAFLWCSRCWYWVFYWKSRSLRFLDGFSRIVFFRDWYRPPWNSAKWCHLCDTVLRAIAAFSFIFWDSLWIQHYSWFYLFRYWLNTCGMNEFWVVADISSPDDNREDRMAA